MRYLVHTVLLFALCSTKAFANDTQLVELIVFRQGSESMPASRIAPDNWANGAPAITAEMQRSTHLGHLAEKLTPEHGYQIVLHKAWLQSSNEETSVQTAISEGQEHFDHYPVEGTLTFEFDRTSTVQLDLWINQFNPDQTLLSSEHFKQNAIVANGQVTFIDYSTLGALIRIQAQKTSTQTNDESHAEDFE